MTPIPRAKILAMRSLAYFLGTGARGLVAANILAFHGLPISEPSDPAPVISKPNRSLWAGFLFAELSRIFKRVMAVTGLVFSLKIFSTAS